MSSHTPGPWRVYDGTSTLSEMMAVFGASPAPPVCRLPLRNVNRKADARLIAAAPDLLEAAKLTVQHFSRNQVSGNFQGDDEHEAWTALDKAITKAEGR